MNPSHTDIKENVILDKPESESNMPDISLIIPLLNEEESLPELAEWIDRTAIAHKLTYEIIFIDDGSTDSSWTVIQKLAARNKALNSSATMVRAQP